jgi:fermentation-respiration switch protein FrsA (DUF1100 family)
VWIPFVTENAPFVTETFLARSRYALIEAPIAEGDSMVVLQIIGILIGVYVLYLLIVAVAPGMSVPGQPLKRAHPPAGDQDSRPRVQREDVSFEVDGATVRAWLFLPEDLSAPAPCVVLGHGFGGTKDCGLDGYAARFREAGFAALAFDYRHLGESGGEPRQLVWIPYQLADYAAAIDYARSRPEIHPGRIALWGTSMSGGHVVVAAARDKDIACVVAQCPGLDGHAAGSGILKREGLGYILRMVMHGQRDLVRSWLRLTPHKIPLVGKSGTIAGMTTPDAYETFPKLVPEHFVNEICARINIRGDKYRPVKHARKVRCPVLLQICDNDNLAPLSAAEETARVLGGLAEVKYYAIGHFDIYFGSHFERSVGDQIEFLKKHL